MLRKMFVVVGSCFEEHGTSFTWLVGLYSKEHTALEVAQKATNICKMLVDTYGYRLLELIDGKVQQQMLKRFGPVNEGNVNSEEYIRTYLKLRSGVVEQYNPYDPNMHIDTTYWIPSTYKVEPMEVDRLPVIPEATVEELERNEGENEDGVGTQSERLTSEGKSDT